MDQIGTRQAGNHVNHSNNDQSNYLNDHLLNRQSNINQLANYRATASYSGNQKDPHYCTPRARLTRQLSIHSSGEHVHQYQNLSELSNSDEAYQVPISPVSAEFKRLQFSQQASRSFPTQCQMKSSVNGNNRTNAGVGNLRKGFQANMALHKIQNHPLTNEISQQTLTSKSSSNQHLPRYCRTQSTSSAVSVQSVNDRSINSNNNASGNNHSRPITTSYDQTTQRRNTIGNKNGTINSSTYSNTPPLPVASTVLLKNSKLSSTQNSINYSMQSFRSNNLPPFAPENYFELNGVESVTSSSYLHGFILITIILLSIAAFVLSKFKDSCEDYFYHINACYQSSQWFFSSMLLIASLYAFIVYFLHLIGQCDYLNMMAKRKVFTEIIATSLIIFCLLISSLTLILTTVAIFNKVNTISLIIAVVVCILYTIRIYLLFREYRMLNDKPVDSIEMVEKFSQLSENNQMNGQINPMGQSNNQQMSQQISNQLANQQSIRRFSLQSNHRISTQLNDDEIDDVFK